MGDDAPSDLEIVGDRFREVNGEHPMSQADDAYVREHFVPATPEQLSHIAAGRLPLPAYLTSDGTPMVADTRACLAAAGGIDRLRDWFAGFWPDDPGRAEEEWTAFVSGQYFYLRRPDPVSIRRVRTMTGQAREAVAALRTDPRDQVAQGSLAEAVDGGLGVEGLDALLLPMTGYDRRRLGGPTPRDVWVDAVRAEFHDRRLPRLPIHTERLTLRLARPEDAAARAVAMADPEFMRFLLSAPQDPAEVDLAMRRSLEPEPDGRHRMLRLVMEHEGRVVGDVVLFLQGAGLTAGEIGWTVHPAAAGRGLATEAARMMLTLAFEHYRVRRVVANLDADHERSAAMAERLGMRREAHRLADFWSKGRWTDSYEYAILRDEWEALQR